MPCHTCSFRRVVVRGKTASLPGDTVMAGPVDKQPRISLASFLAAALHVKHLSPLIAILSLRPLGSMPLIQGPCHHHNFNMAVGRDILKHFLSLYPTGISSIIISSSTTKFYYCPIKYPFCLYSLSDHEDFVLILAKT